MERLHHEPVTLEEKQTIAILSAKGRSNRSISREIGRSDVTVAAVLRKPEIVDLKIDIQNRLATKFEQLAEAILNAVSEEDLLKASLQQKSISAATMVDKARLIRGQTTNNASVFFQIVEASDRCDDEIDITPEG